jgi:ATP-binding cassette, subfamily B, multidrug efflux pump
MDSFVHKGGNNMKRTFQYVWKYKLLFIVPTMAMLISILFDMLNPYLSAIMVDKVIKNKETQLLVPVLMGLAAVTLVRAILGYVKEYLNDFLSTKIHVDIKQELFDHIQSLPSSYFDSMNTGELMSRIGEDVENIWRTLSFGLRLFVENVIYLLIATPILFFINWKLALASIVIIVPIAFLALRLEKKMGESYGKLSDQGAVINTTAQENIAGVRLVKAFAREKHEILKFLGMNRTNYKLSMDQAGILSNYLPGIELFTNISMVIVIALGGIFVINGEMSLGELVAFNGYIWMLIWPMRMLGWLTNMLAQNSASTKKIFKILDTKPDIKDSDNALVLNDMKGHVKFNNVSFKYNDEVVLKNVNIDAKPGSTIAIMGTTGAGKTSIINLIGRAYDVTEGSITIDGIDVKNLALKPFREQMALVSQDTFLFSDSIEQNIRLGKQNATMEELREACKNACALDFIDELENGFDTVIGERGIGLSGGQKQRISIARALARNARILILDDATSALDMETEYELLKNLNSLESKATTFIIAHRISAVKNANEILYVENGNVVEQGTHEELLMKRGKYYEIYCDQFKDFEDIESEVV